MPTGVLWQSKHQRLAAFIVKLTEEREPCGIAVADVPDGLRRAAKDRAIHDLPDGLRRAAKDRTIRDWRDFAFSAPAEEPRGARNRNSKRSAF